MLTRRLATTVAVTVLGAAGLFTAATTANAGDVATVSAPTLGDGVTGHASYKYSTNHGWVCDDLSDGIQVYAVWTFPGDLGDTTFRRDAPAHSTGNGCAGDFFDKKPKHMKVCLNLNNRPDPCNGTDL